MLPGTKKFDVYFLFVFVRHAFCMVKFVLTTSQLKRVDMTLQRDNNFIDVTTDP